MCFAGRVGQVVGTSWAGRWNELGGSLERVEEVVGTSWASRWNELGWSLERVGVKAEFGAAMIAAPFSGCIIHCSQMAIGKNVHKSQMAEICIGVNCEKLRFVNNTKRQLQNPFFHLFIWRIHFAFHINTHCISLFVHC